MRRFRLINDSGYIGLVQGEVYEGRYIHPNTDSSVISCFNEYPEDWEEVFEPESLVFSIPTNEEIEIAVKELAIESTSPDKETPDWMESDIRRGMIWMLNRITGK